MTLKSEVLLVTDVPMLPSSIVMWATKTYGDRVLGSTALTVLTNFLQTGGKLDVETASVEVVISLAETPGFHNWAWLLEVRRVLKMGGDFWIQEPLISRNLIDEEQRRLATILAQDKATLKRSLLLVGFVNVEMKEPIYAVGLSNDYKFITPSHVGSIYDPLLKPFAVQGNKPTWDSGSTFAIKKKVTDAHPGHDQQDFKAAHATLVGPKHTEHYTKAQAEKEERHTEATAQTDTKIYQDVNISARDRNYDRYNPYHQTYNQQTEAMVQTEYHDSKDVLAGGNTPLPTTRGFPKPSTNSCTYNDLRSPYHKEPELMPSSKRSFKLDLSSVYADEDHFDLSDDDEEEEEEEEVLTEGDTALSSHEAHKGACSYSSGQPCELKERHQQTEYPPWGSRRGHLYTGPSGCATCARSPAFGHLEKVMLRRSTYYGRFVKVLLNVCKQVKKGKNWNKIKLIDILVLNGLLLEKCEKLW